MVTDSFVTLVVTGAVVAPTLPDITALWNASTLDTTTTRGNKMQQVMDDDGNLVDVNTEVPKKSKRGAVAVTDVSGSKKKPYSSIQKKKSTRDDRPAIDNTVLKGCIESYKQAALLQTNDNETYRCGVRGYSHHHTLLEAFASLKIGIAGFMVMKDENHAINIGSGGSTPVASHTKLTCLDVVHCSVQQAKLESLLMAMEHHVASPGNITIISDCDMTRTEAAMNAYASEQMGETMEHATLWLRVVAAVYLRAQHGLQPFNIVSPKSIQSATTAVMVDLIKPGTKHLMASCNTLKQQVQLEIAARVNSVKPSLSTSSVQSNVAKYVQNVVEFIALLKPAPTVLKQQSSSLAALSSTLPAEKCGVLPLPWVFAVAPIAHAGCAALFPRGGDLYKQFTLAFIAVCIHHAYHTPPSMEQAIRLMPQRTPAWFQIRNGWSDAKAHLYRGPLISSSVAACALKNKDGYRKSHIALLKEQVWHEFVPRPEGAIFTAYTQRGTAMEPTIQMYDRAIWQKYATVVWPKAQVQIEEVGLHICMTDPWMAASPDGRIHVFSPDDGKLAVGYLEMKCRGAKNSVPYEVINDEYYDQCQHTMALVGVDEYSFVCHSGTSYAFEVYRFDEEAWARHYVRMRQYYWRKLWPRVVMRAHGLLDDDENTAEEKITHQEEEHTIPAKMRRIHPTLAQIVVNAETETLNYAGGTLCVSTIHQVSAMLEMLDMAIRDEAGSADRKKRKRGGD